MQNNEKIVETKICKHCKAKFEITDKDLEFYEKISPIFEGKKYLIPSPTLCPDCRQQRRLSFRNERKLYKRKCDFSGKDIISIYSPDKKYKVYSQEVWWSDKWSALDYGKNFNFEKSFFEQFQKIRLKVPRVGLFNTNSENSDYSMHAGDNKNCYIVCDTANCNNVYYSNWMINDNDCLDCIHITNSQLCFFCTYGDNLFNCIYCDSSDNLINCDFCYECKNCKNCIGCVNLKDKEFFFLNKFVGKEEYIKIKNSLSSSKKFYDILNKFFSLKAKLPNKCLKLNNSENCIGDYLKNSNNSYFCYSAEKLEECKYVNVSIDIKNSMDVCYPAWGEKLYEIHAAIYLSFSKFCSLCYHSNNILYCEHCDNISNCFGCIGLRNKSYCILNKQYTKEEYEKLVPKIIEKMQETGEWGEFFPSSISPFGYNETVANEYFPIESPIPQSQPFYHKGTLPPREKGVEQDSSFPLKGGGLMGSFNRSFYETPFPKVEKIIPADNLPDDISKIPDDILNWAIECEKTGKPFRIIKQELEFYRKHNLPIPKIHPDQRNLDRMALRNPRKLFERICDKCGKDIKTTYSPERPEIVYCESCYEKEVY